MIPRPRSTVILNPAAGGGRASRLMPRVTAELDRLGLTHRVEPTASLEHARQLAREAAARGEIAVAFGGDGLIGAVAGALAGTDAVMGVLPGGRGNDFARALGITSDPVGACRVLQGATDRRIDLGVVGARTFIGIASCGFDSVANRIANETRVARGNLVYAYGALAALVGWRPATFTVTVDDGRPRTIDGYTVAVANSCCYGGGMRLAPDARVDDGLLDAVTISAMPRWRFLKSLPTVFSGSHVVAPEFEIVRGRSVRIAASRPFTLYADGDPLAELPVTVELAPAAVRVLAPTPDAEPADASSESWSAPRQALSSAALDAKVIGAQTVGAIARRAGRGGGTSLPGKLLTRAEPHAIARLSARLPDGSAVISATNGKTTTAAMAASILTGDGISLVSNRAGANMAGGVASALLHASRPGGRIDGRLGLFEVDELWLDGVAPALAPRALLLGNLFRDQLDRYGELETIADRWAQMTAALPAPTQLALNADDPLIADLGRERDGVTYFGVQDRSLAIAEMQHASDSKHCRRCGHAYHYDAIYLGHLGVYRCPHCGQRRPEPAVAATDVRLHGTRAASFTLTTPAGDAPVQLPLPGLYNVYNALGATALCLSLGVTLERIAAGLSEVSAAFGRSERIVIGERELTVLLIKNPAGANEVLRTLTLEPGRSDLLGILNDRTADGRDVSWIWDADFELLAGAVGHVTCAGTRAAELALRLKYAGVDEARLEVVAELPQALDRALAQAASGRVFALPTYTALLELRAELERRGHVDAFWAPGRR